MKNLKSISTQQDFNSQLYSIERPWVMLAPNGNVNHTCLRFRLMNVKTAESISGGGQIFIDNVEKNYITDGNGIFVIPDIVNTNQEFSIHLRNFKGENTEEPEKEKTYKRYTEIVKFNDIFDHTLGLIEGIDGYEEAIEFTTWKHEDWTNPKSDSDHEYDIDTHAIIYYNNNRLGEVNYNNTNYEDENIHVSLDLDDTGSNNGETLSIVIKTPEGANYIVYYAMYDWKNGENPVINPFKERNCNVAMTDKDGQTVRIYPPNDNIIATIWRICTIQNGRMLEEINEITSDNTGIWHITNITGD